ncbi:MAG TPA: hypothetical protein VFL27_07310 [Candidatus Dormibacteraeota bacterium]|nr:hypothetical protein [Candidatus Dormibacteraeota bacterium]
MANVTLLLASNSADPPSEYEPPDALLGANYSVPLLWLSMFTPAEIVLWLSTIDPTVSYAAVVGERDACINRSSDRIGKWSRLWPETFSTLGPTWTTFAEARHEPFFAVWTEELAEMHESPEDWLQAFKMYLEALDRPDEPGFVDVLAQSYLAIEAGGKRLVGTSEGSIGLLCAGYSWGVKAPWE